MPHEAVWRLLLAVAERRRRGTLPNGGSGLRLDENGALRVVDGRRPGSAPAQLIRQVDGRIAPGEGLTAAERELVEPYLPLLAAGPERPVVVAHLGQSVDGCIATASGDSDVVTGAEDFTHMHRLRALADAVVVGGGTVAADDPRLTTRLVAGPNPVRVVLDPAARLGAGHGVFVDGLAPTLHVHGTLAASPERRATELTEHAAAYATEPATATGATHGAAHVERVVVPDDAPGLSLAAVLDALRARGLHAVFVEGGGVTVTRWIEAGLVDRLHLAVAPVIVGLGRPALQLPGAASMRESLRPPCRLYRLGRDILWDFDLAATRDASPSGRDGEGGDGDEGDIAVDERPFRRLL